MFTITTGGGTKTIVGAGQKSGIYAAFDPDNDGALLWATQVGPGGRLGGIEWGSATDGVRVYVAISNIELQPYTLQPSGQLALAGSWSALNPATGQILWQTADPTLVGGFDLAPMTVGNGVVFGASMSAVPIVSRNMFALDAATGAIRWRFA
jgi:polyvinyl alcohol dehydrogenase (cytochrome)